MSEFQYILTPAQLTKHYELIQFLTQHPNQAYTLAQLDTLLPHGVAVQRFPEEWFDLIADGACWHRSIELQRPSPASPTGDGASPSSSPPPPNQSVELARQQFANSANAVGGVSSVLEASAATAQARAAQRTEYRLSCVKSEVKTLEELRSRLESPSTLLDVEGCVALHTDQILIEPELILRAQRVGLVYYFPDVYDKNDYRQFGLKDTTAGGASSSSGGEGGAGGAGSHVVVGKATAALLDAFMSQEEGGQRKRGGGSGSSSSISNRTYIALPPGVRVQHQLLTRRGVPEQEDHCLPTTMYVGERLRLLFDNVVAVTKLHQKNELNVQLSMKGIKARKGERALNGMVSTAATGAAGGGRLDALSSEPPPPLRIRREAQPVRHHTTTPPVPLSTPASASTAHNLMPGSDPPQRNEPTDSSTTTSAAELMLPPAPMVVSTTCKVEMEAVYGCTFTLLLTVNGMENVLNVEVLEETTAMPGVLILRDRQLDSFGLPQQDMLPDPLVNPPLEAHYPFEAVLPPLSASSSSLTSPREQDQSAAAGSLSSAQREALASGAWTELVPLPWTQNASPVLMSLREATYPTQHATVQVATRTVFSAQSLADEARLRQTRDRLRREAERRDGTGGRGGKRRRMRFRGNMILSNRHLLHFGLDFSIPFTRPASGG